MIVRTLIDAIGGLGLGALVTLFAFYSLYALKSVLVGLTSAHKHKAQLSYWFYLGKRGEQVQTRLWWRLKDLEERLDHKLAGKYTIEQLAYHIDCQREVIADLNRRLNQLENPPLQFKCVVDDRITPNIAGIKKRLGKVKRK